MMHATTRVVISSGKRGLRCSHNPFATTRTRSSALRLLTTSCTSFRRDLELFQIARIRIGIRIRPLSSSSRSSSSNKSKDTPTSPPSSVTTLTEHPIRPQAPTTIYTLEKDESWSVSKNKVIVDEEESSSDASKKKRTTATPQSLFFENVLTHFLPANYPASVAPGYDRFASLCFCASVAGSAGMVLSTQTLLLAVGIVGQNVQTASIMAGALNWVLKDGIGQLGGVWFASYMGRSGSSQFDANPKYWRMTAAICLDAATFLEITAPLVPPGAVLALASVANVGKNIGFLTASASRAALHQSLAISGNLGDVTAKTASQSMAASLVGTALGIGLSPLLEDVPHFLMGFLVLSILHQGCNYLSLQAVPLPHFNRHRLHLVLQHAIAPIAGNNSKNNTTTQQQETTTPTAAVLSPAQVAAQETFLPLLTPDDSHDWLVLGSTIKKLGGPAAAAVAAAQEDGVVSSGLSSSKAGSNYLLTKCDDKWHLVFSRDAEASDLIEGMYHAYWIHAHDENGGPHKKDFNEFWKQLQDQGWHLETEVLRIEPPKAVRIDYTVTG